MDMGAHTFLNGISLKINIIAWLVFYNVVVSYFSRFLD